MQDLTMGTGPGARTTRPSFAVAVDPLVKVRRAKLAEVRRALRAWEASRREHDRARFVRVLDELARLVGATSDR